MSSVMATKLMLYGLIVGEQLLLAGFFFRFWRSTRDPLFAFFTAGFLMMSVHRVMLGFAVAGGLELEQQSWVFVVRLVAYLLFLAGIVGKNLQRRGR